MYGKNVSQVVKYVEPLVPHTRILARVLFENKFVTMFYMFWPYTILFEINTVARKAHWFLAFWYYLVLF